MIYGDKKVFALIPARKGSKGVVNKNIIKILNKPLIDYTIDAALKSKKIDQIFISSDSEKILKYITKYENIIGIKRPSKFATNKSTAVDVVKHFFEYLSKLDILKKNEDFYIIYLQPTSPLRNEKIINRSLNALVKSKLNSLISLVENNFSPYKFFQINKKGQVNSLFNQSLSNLNRQDLPKTYRANGAIYIFKASLFKKLKGFPSNNSLPFLMNQIDSLDIDSYQDIDTLELELENRKNL